MEKQELIKTENIKSETMKTEPKKKAKNLLTKIGRIQQDISSLVKDETNKHQNYKYFDEAQILKILKPLLAEEQLTLT